MELKNPVRIPDKMFFKIGEVAKIINVKPFVLRFWETEFPFLAPNKASNQQRMYTRLDVENALLVKHLLHDQRFSIEGAKKRISELRKQGELAKARTPEVLMSQEKLGQIDKAKAILAKILEISA